MRSERQPCLVCPGGRLEPGHTNITLSRENAMIVVKEVPANVCV